MKSLLLWMVTVLALVAAAVFYISNKSKSAELAKLRPQLQELESLRAQAIELKGGQLSAEELDRVRKNTEELLRLRNEVRQLRDTEKQLTQQVQKSKTAADQAQAQADAARTQAQAQAQQAQAQLQAQAQALAAATNAPPLTPEQQAQQQQRFAERYGLAAGAPGPQVRTCVNQMRQLEGAKQQWALENNKPENATPSAQDLLPYLRNEFPKCPSGGVYALNSGQNHVTCSAQGHAVSP